VLNYNLKSIIMKMKVAGNVGKLLMLLKGNWNKKKNEQFFLFYFVFWSRNEEKHS
jgi:hypothetical protein